MKEIKGIGFSIPSDEEDDYIKLDSRSSLSEADIAILDPSFYSTDYSTYTGSMHDDGRYNGKGLYNHESSAQIQEHASHWRNEINSYLKTGKTLFIILSEKKSFYIHTGRQEFSGTGKNRQTTNIVADYDNYKFLPTIDGIKYNVAHGKKILSADLLFHHFTKQFEKFCAYETFLSVDVEFRNGLISKNRDKILGGVLDYNGGHIVFLPKIDLNKKEFTEYDEDDNAFWTKEAKIVGKQFVQALVEIDVALRKSSNATPRPEWLNSKSYELRKSSEIRIKIQSNRNKISELNDEIQKLQLELDESEVLNDLLFETGKALENAVTYALRILGFHAENFDDGELELDQVLVSPEGVRYIGECEGKDNKSIDISKFRQLSDALNEDFERDEVEEKAFGILFGNPYRISLPSSRKQPFTDKCKKGALREKIGLIETKELYKAARYLMENKDSKYQKECREVIFKKLGQIIKFPNTPNKEKGITKAKKS